MGFVSTFNVPFRREDLYAELFLASSEPLGTAAGTKQVLDPAVKRFLIGEYGGVPSSTKPHRKLTMAGGASVTYAMAECKPYSLVAWDIVHSEGEMAVHGKDGALPRIAFKFLDVPGGTSVTIVFDFERAVLVSETGWFKTPTDQTAKLKSNFDNFSEAWRKGMQQRGYDPLPPRSVPRLEITRPAPVLLTPSTVVGSASDRSAPTTRRSGGAEELSEGSTERDATERPPRALRTKSKPFWQVQQEREQRKEREQHVAAAAADETLASAAELPAEPLPKPQPPSSKDEGEFQYGLRTFRFTEPGPMGIVLEPEKMSAWEKPYLCVRTVKSGSLAEQAGVPLGGFITGINGQAVGAGTHNFAKIDEAVRSTQRPLYVSVYYKPPKPTKEPAAGRSIFRLFGRRTSGAPTLEELEAKAKPREPTPTTTPDSTSRSAFSSEVSC